MTNLTFVASMAYKAALLPLLLPEASYVSEQLKLPTPHPIRIEDIQTALVGTPKFGFSGSIETTNFFFTFPKGKLYFLGNKLKHDEQFDLYPEWAKTPSLVDSNGAYQLATQWLAAIDVDVAALERKYPHQIEQAFYWGRALGTPENEWTQHPPTTNRVMLPIFTVTWGGGSDYPAQIQLLGTTKELMTLRMADASLSRRPALVITNAMELNNIPDPQIKQLTPAPGKMETNRIPDMNAPADRPPPFRQQVTPKE